MTGTTTSAAQPDWVGPHVLVLNGPNLGRLGTREPHIYGHTTHAELTTQLEKFGQKVGLHVEVRQTDAEHEMISWLHEATDRRTAVVINPAAWTHTSIALRDAATPLTSPLIEVHISNVHAREEFRHHSYLSPVATGVIAGLGLAGYEAALSWLAAQWHESTPTV